MKKTVPQIILDLLEETFNEGEFKWFREGDPLLIPASRLPALIATETQTDYNAGPTGHDEIVHHILLQVVLNKKDEIGNPDADISLDRKLSEITQGRSETTGDFLDNTIMGVLRRHITIGNLAIENIGRVRLGVIPRSEDLMTAEAHIELTITELQAIANRS